MKPRIAVWLLIGVMLAPLSGLAQTQFLSIAALRAQTPVQWTQTFETKWRTVAVDAAILLPEAETVPIAVIGYDRRDALYTAQQSGWDTVDSRDDGLILYREGRKVPRKVDGKPVNANAEAKENWYGGFAPENCYVTLCNTSFGEICTLINAELTRFGYDPDDFAVASPMRLWAQHWYYYGVKKDALPGHILMEMNLMLFKLPILTHIMDAVYDHENGESRTDEINATFQLSAGYDGYEQALSHLFICAVKPLDILADDVPLCPLEQIKAQVASEIQAGHIRKVYELRLGYVLYNEPGVYREKGGEPIDAGNLRFYAKPVWQIDCLYVQSATGKLRKLPDDVYDERNSLDYRRLLIDAQTGEWISESKAKTRCEYPGFLSWADVGQ
jgi:hypothetical protein